MLSKGVYLAFWVGMAAVLSNVSGEVQAHARDGDRSQIRLGDGQRLMYERLFTVRSRAGETLDDFVLRVGPRLRAFSDATGFEACGVLASDGERFGVVVGTNHAQMGCLVQSSQVPQGMTPMVDTLHSHGRDRSQRANRSDLVLIGEVLARMGGVNPRGVYVQGQELNRFSDADYEGGPGYLAGTEGRVFHQEGRGTQREVKPSPGSAVTSERDARVQHNTSLGS